MFKLSVIILSVAIKSIMLRVVRLSVVGLNVVSSRDLLIRSNTSAFKASVFTLFGC